MGYYSAPRRFLRGLRQLVYPRRCPFCGRVLGSIPECPDCAQELDTLRRKPSMKLDPAKHYISNLSGGAAPFQYAGCVRQGVLRAKYQASPWAAVELGVWMAKLVYGSEIRMCGAEPVPQKVDGVSRVYNAIVPVPPSGTKRGYNVPYLMALPLAEATGVPLYENALCRARKKKHQAGLPFYERVANVAGAFRVICQAFSANFFKYRETVHPLSRHPTVQGPFPRLPVSPRTRSLRRPPAVPARRPLPWCRW